MSGPAAAPASTVPDLLRQPLPELRALQDRLLRETIELCYESHPFYARLMRAEGLEPRHIQTCDDLTRLPLSSKTDFLADPEAFRLRPGALPPELETVWKVIYTTGTTSGRPAPIYVTAHDHFAYLYASARRGALVDIRDTDILANLFPLTAFPMGAYGRAVDEVAAAGAAIVFAHTGRPETEFPVSRSLDDAVRLVERHRATILWGIAGFVRRVLVRAAELGADFRSVRMAMITGEASSGAMRDDMRRRMAALGARDTLVVNRYGSTEQGGSMVECVEGSGFHSLAPDQIHHEVVDPATGQRLPDGTSGMLAFTHLNRRGTIFLRYLVGDVVTMDHAPCPHCGRTCPRISSQPVRSGDIVKIKGTLVNLQVLKDQIEKLAAIQEYQIVVQPMNAQDPYSMDELVIRAAVSPGQQDATAASLIIETTRTIHIRPRIVFDEADAIFDPLGKAKPQRISIVSRVASSQE